MKIDSLSFFANHIVVSEREGGLDYLRVIDMKTKASHRIATTEPDYTMSLGNNPEFDTTTVRFIYQSMVTPSSTFEYDLSTKQQKLLKQQEVLGGYDPRQYEARRVWAVARDGTKVPISVVSKKGVKLDGKAPLLLYRVRLVRRIHGADVFVEPIESARSRRRSTPWPTFAAVGSSARTGANRGG